MGVRDTFKLGDILRGMLLLKTVLGDVCHQTEIEYRLFFLTATCWFWERWQEMTVPSRIYTYTLAWLPEAQRCCFASPVVGVRKTQYHLHVSPQSGFDKGNWILVAGPLKVTIRVRLAIKESRHELDVRFWSWRKDIQELILYGLHLAS